VTDDPLKRRESPLLGVYATTTLRKGRGGSSPPSSDTRVTPPVAVPAARI